METAHELTKFALSLNKRVLPIFDTNETAKEKVTSSRSNTSHVSTTPSSDASKPKRFSCKICSRDFKTVAHFDYHLKAHSGIKPFACTICFKRFITKQALNQHCLTHSKTRNPTFICKVCGKKFLTKQNLHNHVNTHTEEKPFECKQCLKRFAEKSTLTKHMTTHTKVKKYSCCLCNKKFTQISSQHKHMKKFHMPSVSDYGGFLPTLGAEVVTSELQFLENNFKS